MNWFRAEDIADRSGDILVPFGQRWRPSFEMDRIRAIFRRRVPTTFRPHRLYVYIASPDKEMLGYCVVEDLKKVNQKEAERYVEEACIEREDLRIYFTGYDEIGLYVVGPLKKLSSPLSLEELRDETGFTPPQSFVALSQRASSFLSQREGRSQ